MDEPYNPGKRMRTADEMADREAQAMRLAILAIERIGGQLKLTQDELTDAAKRRPTLKVYFDPFDTTYVYEVQTQEQAQEEINA